MPISGEKLQDGARDTALVLPGVSNGRPFTEELDVYKVAYQPNLRYPALGGVVTPGWSALVATLPDRPITLAIDGPAALDWSADVKLLNSALEAWARSQLLQGEVGPVGKDDQQDWIGDW
ncbi:hypothetical protein [Streptomyces sp. CA-106110]|uniref:hypothetical protein n=1 Tax=Streptomyces sp. CA-106110 TaxID=3240044 RepID=UPI003D91CD20